MKPFFEVLVTINGKPNLYLDPSSGSMIIQMVIAAVLGLGVVVRVFWKNIKAFFTGKKVDVKVSEDPTAVFTDDPTALPSSDKE